MDELPGLPPKKEAYTLNEIRLLRQQAATLENERAKLRARLRELESEISLIDRTIDSLSPGRSNPLIFRTPYGGVRDAILMTLRDNPDGLLLADLSELLHSRLGTAIHSRTPSSTLNRLQKEGLVLRKGRRWLLSE